VERTTTEHFYVIQNGEHVALIGVDAESQVAATVATAQAMGLCPAGPYTVERVDPTTEESR
jgi:hypothetical protein